jgi:simple sugar transport system permease protein
LLSLLYLGGEAVQMSLNVPASLARSFQGMLLFFLLAADVLILHRVRITRR